MVENTQSGIRDQIGEGLLPQADHPLLVGAVVDLNLSNDLLLFIEEIHMNNTVAIICSKMQNLRQIFQ